MFVYKLILNIKLKKKKKNNPKNRSVCAYNLKIGIKQPTFWWDG